MVSRYVVDGIQVAGLVIGTVGVQRLASGTLDEERLGLRQLLGAALAGLLGAVYALGSPSSAEFADTVRVAWVVIFAAMGFYVGYTFTGRNRHVLYVIVPVAVVSLIEALRYTAGVVPNDLVRTVLQVPIVYLLWGGFVWLSAVFNFPRAKPLTSRRRQLIGLILTLVGFAAQLVPPVLDLLGIKIV